ncbi:MAG: Cytochrome c554 and c-prime [Candidatus Electronema aureum]|uniref:Cytochrome c554 and c-prime n=1 Tax=Candidatus Electronema aureum TaxID=2005002 RepID=A0A521G0H2_9BACT|nr:MAG: Cytochrome c554 and c-prime [Candidatus Electronema aureum]
MARNCIGLILGLTAGTALAATAAFAKTAPEVPTAPTAPTVAVPAYSRYNMEEWKKKFPNYPSHLKLDEALSKEDAKFNAPSVATCAGCHPQQYEEWQNSMHSMAFQDPVYLGELNLAVKAVGKDIAKQCEGCHTPAAFLLGETAGEFDFDKLSPLAKAGVSCDVCHSIKQQLHQETPSGEPENGSYLLSPNRKDEKTGQAVLTKYGPFPNYEGCGGGFHECVESPLHRTSEMCAGCHQVFHYKEHTPLEHTYAEWKKSIYAVKGVQCQDCHMVDIDTFKRSADSFVLPKRGEYRHYFNGANFVQYFLAELKAKKEGDTKMAENAKKKFDMAVERLQAAAELEVEPFYNAKGDLSKIRVRVHNRRAGHNLPTSLTNIRQMWLEVVITDASGKELLKSGYLDSKGELDPKTYNFNSDGMGNDLSFKLDPWDVVAFSRHDTIPPKGYRDLYYTLVNESDDQEIKFSAKLRFRQASQAVVEKLLSNQPKGVDLGKIYGLTAVPAVPVVDMTEKSVTIKTKGTPESVK